MTQKASPRSTWYAHTERWPMLRRYLPLTDATRRSWLYNPERILEDNAYLEARPWLRELGSDEFAAWFWSQSESQPDGCRLWGPEELRVTFEGGWSESAHRIAWCLHKWKEPGAWLGLFRTCPNDRCVNPGHQYHVGELIDFYSRVRRVDSGCWIWQGSLTRDGYGRYCVEGKEVRAHVYAWEYEFEPTRGRWFVCHRCDTRACVNPSHLFACDHRSNMADMVAKGRQCRGARHPRARIHPEQARNAIAWVLGGVPETQVARYLGISASTMRVLLRGEHWLQETPVELHGEAVDLKWVSVRGRLVGPLCEQILSFGGTLARFRLQPVDRYGGSRRGGRLEVECCGILTEDQRPVFDRLVADQVEVGVSGELGPFGDPNRDPRRCPAFEILVPRLHRILDDASGRQESTMAG